MKRIWVAAAALVLFGLGTAGALAVGESTGTVSACATATTPAHTVAVDTNDVYTVPGDTATHCETTTFTIPTSTVTVTQTVQGTTTTTTPTNTASPVRINAGGAAFTDGTGNVWAADENFTGGILASSTNAVAGTTDDALFQKQRYNTGSFSYVIPNLPQGTYTVNLKFAEMFGFAAGKRQFNVDIQGTRVLTNFDIAADVGQNTADTKTFTATVGSDGNLTIAFSRGAVDNPTVAGIEVLPSSNPSSPPSSASVSGQSMPTGDLTSNGTNWHQVFSDDFPSAENIALGGYCGDPAGFPHPANVSGKWNAYPYTWTSTWTKAGTLNSPATWTNYCPERTTSIHDGVMDVWMHDEVDKNAGQLYEVTANQPVISGQTYGRYVVRYKQDTSFPGYHLSWLLWPSPNPSYCQGEMDFPENDTNSTSISGFVHYADVASCTSQYAFNTPVAASSGWHTATIEWTPSSVTYFMDGNQIGQATSHISSLVEHWVIQFGGACGSTKCASVGNGHVEIDWLAIYTKS